MIKETTQLALKSWTAPKFWLIIVGVLLLCLFTGPFGTFENLPVALRLFYWGVIVVTTSMLGAWGHALIVIGKWTTKRQVLFVSIVFGLCVSFIVIFCSYALLDPIDFYPGPSEIFLYSFPSSVLIFFISILATSVKKSELDVESEENEAASKRPDLFERLQTFRDAQHIFALNAQDHYVEVVTELGSELCLIRLNDAIAETKPIKGLQIHRSTWISAYAIKHLDMNNGKPQLTLIDGRSYRVSQARLKELKPLCAKMLS